MTMTEAARPLLPSRPHSRVTVRRCQELVAAEYGMSVTSLLDRSRRQPLARIRQIAMYLATQLTAASLPDIGTRFGGKDHTTIMYARDRIALLMGVDQELRREVERLASKLIDEAAT